MKLIIMCLAVRLTVLYCSHCCLFISLCLIRGSFSLCFRFVVLSPHASHQNCEEFTFSLQIFSWMTTALLVIIMVFVVAPLRSRVKLAVNQESLIDEDSVEDLTKI